MDASKFDAMPDSRKGHCQLEILYTEPNLLARSPYREAIPPNLSRQFPSATTGLHISDMPPLSGHRWPRAASICPHKHSAPCVSRWSKGRASTPAPLWSGRIRRASSLYPHASPGSLAAWLRAAQRLSPSGTRLSVPWRPAVAAWARRSRTRRSY
jgi:hypothetical protein